LGIKVRIFHGW